MPKISVIVPIGRSETETDQTVLKEWEQIAKLPDKDIILKSGGVEDVDFNRLLFSAFSQSPSTYLTPLLNSLNNQTFKDFEVILVDRCYEERKDIIKSLNYDYVIRHIPEKHSPWHDRKITPELKDWIENVFPEKNRLNMNMPFQFPTVCSARNTGIINANGELLVFLDDTMMIKEIVLERCWKNYIHDKLGSLILRNKYFLLKDGNIRVYPDVRTIHSTQTWSFGFAISLEDMLNVNGFDEDYDGGFGGEDSNLSYRLERYGFKSRIQPDIRGYELGAEWQHIGVGRIPIRHNECMVEWIRNHDRNMIIANIMKPTKEQIAFMREHQKTIWTWEGKPVPEHPYAWDFPVPIFNLRGLRK